MISHINTTTVVTYKIQPASDDPFDRAYRFGLPLSYLSERQQARVLIMRGRLHALTAELQLDAS